MVFFKVKDVCLQFVLHCYIETGADIKDLYNIEFLEQILANILEDIQKVSGSVILKCFKIMYPTFSCCE